MSTAPTLDKDEVRKRTDFHAFYLREFGGRLGHVKTNGDCMMPCVVHDDTAPSLAVNIINGNFCCFGCGAGGDVFKFAMLRYGLSFADAVKYVAGDSNSATPARPAPIQRKPAKSLQPSAKKKEQPHAPIDVRKPSFVFPYYAPNGRCLFYIFRWDKPGHEKTMRPGYFTETGELILKMPPGVKRTLYNLHRTDDYKDASGRIIRGFPLDETGRVVWPPTGERVNLSVTASQVVYLVEGEKCAEVLLALGLCATTSGSANTWRAEYAELLREKTVIIIPDADDPGEKYALQAAKDLVGVADSVRILRLEGLSEGEDVADWIQAKGGI